MPGSSLPPTRKWDPAGPAIGAVHVIHGLSEHPDRYGQLASALNDARFVVWAHHQRGHGRNPEPGIRGHFADRDGWRSLIDDAWAVSERLRSESGLPLVLFAHSMGSFVGQGVLAEHGAAYRAAIFSGTNGPPAVRERVAHGIARVQLAALGARHPGSWLQKLVIEETYNAAFGRDAPPNTWLSRDEQEVAKYTNDPDCGFPLTSRAWLDLLDGRAAQSSVAFFSAYPRDLPVHIIAGTADPVGERARGVRRLLTVLARANLSNVTSTFYEDARHELAHEINRAEVLQDIVRWLQAVVPA